MRPARHMPKAMPSSNISKGAIKSPSRQPGRALAMLATHATIGTGAVIWNEFTISGCAFKGNQICTGSTVSPHLPTANGRRDDLGGPRPFRGAGLRRDDLRQQSQFLRY